MKTIVLASRKGGAGKTTLSGHLAVEAEAAGFGRVAVMDADPQRGLASWWDVRQDETPRFHVLDPNRIRDSVIAAEAAHYDLLIIDTPPQVTDTIERVMACADLIVIPTRPSPHDLRAVGGTVDLAERAGRPFVFVVNGAAHRARITTQTAVALSQHGPVAPVILHQRTDFAASMTDGRTVRELDPASKSAAEIQELWTYIAQRLNREARHVAVAIAS